MPRHELSQAEIQNEEIIQPAIRRVHDAKVKLRKAPNATAADQHRIASEVAAELMSAAELLATTEEAA